MNGSIHVVCPHCLATNRVPAERMADQPTCGRCKTALFTAHPTETDATSFEAHIARNDLPVVVDFWAPWCAPCRTMAPAFAEAARRLEPRVRLLKVNTEEHPTLAARFSIRSIPTMVLFRNGREIARQSGAMDVSSLMHWVSAQL